MKDLECHTCRTTFGPNGRKVLAKLGPAGVEIFCRSHRAIEVIPYGVIDRFRASQSRGLEPRMLPDASAQPGGSGRAAGRGC